MTEGEIVRLLVVAGLTLTLLLGAVPLAVPGLPPRLPGLPPLVSATAFGVAGVALLAGLVLLGRGRRALRRVRADDAAVAPVPPAAGPVAPRPAPVPAPVPSPVSGSGDVAVRTRW